VLHTLLTTHAGGDTVKVWDVLGSGQLLHSFSNHAKTITCLTVSPDATRLLSASLDGHVKVHDLQVRGEAWP
jgi:U3 small nucleolar RNA-associated protein 15